MAPGIYHKPILKMYSHTTFRVPTSNSMHIFSRLDLHVSRTEVRGQSQTESETVAGTQWPKYLSTYQRTSDGGNGNNSVSLPILLIKI